MMKYIMFGGYVRFEKRSNRISNIELNRKHRIVILSICFRDNALLFVKMSIGIV